MKDKLKKEIGCRMQQLRKTIGFTQDKMTTYFDIGRANYSRIERGDIFPNPRLMYSLKKEFNVSLDWVITGEGDMFLPEDAEETRGHWDFGSHNREIKDLLYHMKHIPMVLHQVLGFFLNYRESNKQVIQELLDSNQTLPEEERVAQSG